MMRLFKACRARKLNKKGFTLIEIVIAMAILAVVGTVITGFIVLSTNSFKAGTVQVDLQYDAQQSANQIKSVIMEANAGVAMVPSDGTSDPYLLIYNYSEDTSGATPTEVYEVVKLVYDVTDKKIYYGEATFGAIVDIDTTFAANEMVAQHVETFNVDTSEVTANGVALLNMRFEAEDGSYTVNSAVTLRNKVIASANASAVYSGTRVERNRFVRSVRIMSGGTEIPTGDNFSINRPLTGIRTVTFKAEVDAYGYGTDVYWTLANATSADTKIGTDGVLMLGSDETATSLLLTATSVADNSKSSSVNILVMWGYSNGFSNFSITSRTPYNATSSTTGGREEITIHCEANYVNESNLPDEQKGYDWSVSFPEGITSSDYQLIRIDDTTAKLIAYHNTSAKDFTVTVTSKATDSEGRVVSADLSNTVATLMQPGEYVDVSATVDWSTFGTDLCRNTTYNFSTTIVGITNPTYKWEVIDASPSNGGKIKVDGRDNRANVAININQNLDWNQSFTFKLKLTVSGTSNTTGRRETISNTSPEFTVGQVRCNLISPTGITTVFDPRGDKWGRYDISSSFNIKLEVTNVYLTSATVYVYCKDSSFWDEDWVLRTRKSMTVNTAGKTGNKSVATLNVDYSKTKIYQSDYSTYSTATLQFDFGSYTYEKTITLTRKIN